MIDKSTRQHYAIQGGGPNYLGKQKMVKAPKKWQSSPDHEPAELAYITKKEKDILLDLDIYGSLKNGKPNRGPSGIISLQGDMGGYGGTGGGGGSGGGGGGQDRHPNRGWQTYTAPAPAPAPAPSPHRDSAANLIAEATAMETARKTAEANQAVQEARSKALGTSLHGGPTYDQDKVDLTKMIRDQALEKMDYIPDDTTQLDLNKFGETVEYKNHPEAIQKQLEETTKQLSTPKGTKEALREFQALKTGRQYIPDVGLLERLGIKKPQGILSNLTSGKCLILKVWLWVL